ncbi:MAG: tetratricopeptide repeat protein [Planctomycetes bacterium]|nr:tetratricopeptide repeat protein [Planctomycetota bacterium]
MAIEEPAPDPTTRPLTELLGRLRQRREGSSAYRHEGEIARGGMGAILRVWDEALRRPMAMKVALGDRGQGTTADIAHDTTPLPDEERRLSRFLEEAQITGQLEHPGIVPVHELGLDEHGRAFFTMRLVRGRDLEEIFSLVADGTEGWNLTRAVGVLLRVCEAMAFAHDRKVLHRDLKPANVMVGAFGEVYVMDWGIARVLGEADRHDVRLQPVVTPPAQPGERVATDRHEHAHDSASHLYTMDGDIIGTPAYMSPEQARGLIDQLDARADVYSLGAMLYRLLAGEAPYEREDDGSAYAMLRQLLAGPPTPLARLAPGAPAELIAIADKAMAHDPDARYPTMLALADDLRAYLENRVVAAFETGAWAEARKWIGRNKALAASLSMAVLLLIGGLATSLMFAQQARREATRADAEREVAVANAAEAVRQQRVAEAVNSFLNDDLLAAVAPEHMGVDVTVREVLDQAALQLDWSFDDQPEVEAALHLTIGNSFSRLGDPAAARRHFERAIELGEDLPDGAEGVLKARLGLASASSDAGDVVAAEAAYRAARAAAAAMFGERHRSVLSADNDLALLLQHSGRRAEARELYERTIAAEESALGRDAQNTVTTRANLAQLLTELGELDTAEALLVEAVAQQERGRGIHHPLTIDARNSLALLHIQQGKLEQAERELVEVLRLRAATHGDDHLHCARALTSLGNVRSLLANHAAALTDLERAVGLLRPRLGADHPWTLDALGNLCAALLNAGRPAEALPQREALLAAQRRVHGDEHPDTLLAMSNLAALYNELGRRDDAERLGRETLALEERVLGVDHPSTLITRENLGGVLFAMGRLDESTTLTEAVLEGRRRTLGEQHPAVTKSLYNLAMVRKAGGANDEAEGLFREVLERNRRELPADHPSIADTLARLGALRSAAKDFAAAEPLLREALAIRRQTFAPDASEVTVLLHDLGVLRYRVDDVPGAIALLREAYDLRVAAHGEQHLYTRTTGFVLGLFLKKAQRWNEVEPLLIAWYDFQVASNGPDNADAQRAVKALIELYEATGRADDAAKWRERAR